MEEVVTLQLEAPLALVTLNRPKSLNALNSEVYRQLIAILRQVEGMDAIKAVILTGAGDKAFAAGADIAQMVHEDWPPDACPGCVTRRRGCWKTCAR